jgi:hypothetical protein
MTNSTAIVVRFAATVVAYWWRNMHLQNAALLKLVIDRDGQDTSDDLRHNVRTSIITRDAAIVEGHDRHRGIEVTTGDCATQETEDRQGRTDCPGITRGNDDRQKNERAQELDEDGQKVHQVLFCTRDFVTNHDSELALFSTVPHQHPR